VLEVNILRKKYHFGVAVIVVTVGLMNIELAGSLQMQNNPFRAVTRRNVVYTGIISNSSSSSSYRDDQTSSDAAGRFIAELLTTHQLCQHLA